MDARHDWLATHSRQELRPTVYRTKCFKAQIQRSNWSLAEPVNANGIEVQ
ncbi:hypothetical protein [Adhaeribacter pallidiroseus]|nr:hypothetical protein [Adhaeribacter pallidiroseus]